MIRIFRRALFSLLLLPFLQTPVAAYDLPAVNLGFTSFLDGGPPAGPGLYLSEYLQFYSSDELTDKIGAGEVDVRVLMNQLIYQSDQPVLFGGKWGLNIMLPVVDFDADVLPENRYGFGDLLIGPYIQWDPVMGAKGPLFMHRIELQTILPTGRYDADYALNPGSNHYSFDPYWAATVFLGPRATVSWRLHYLWNGKNDDPFIGSGLDSIKPGQAWHANFAAAYEVWPRASASGGERLLSRPVHRKRVQRAKVFRNARRRFSASAPVWSGTFHPMPTFLPTPISNRRPKTDPKAIVTTYASFIISDVPQLPPPRESAGSSFDARHFFWSNQVI